HGNEIRGGFSGAPVWDLGGGGVLGIIAEADSDRRTATMIPTDYVRSVTHIAVKTADLNEGQEAGSDQGPIGLTRISLPRALFDLVPLSWHYNLTAKIGYLPDPPERATIERYLRDFAADLSSKIREKTYIQPLAKEVVGPVPQLSRKS